MTPAWAVLGKVPWYPEFLRPQARADLARLDEWLFRNEVPSFDEGAARSSYGFMLNLAPARDSLEGIVGVLAPSHDSAGRSYPLVVAGRVTLARDLAAHPEITPIVFEAHWNAALDVMREAAVGPDEAAWDLERLDRIELESATAAFELYSGWLDRVGVESLGALVGRSGAWLRRAVQAVAPGIGMGARSVRVPLGRGAGGALCFWIDVVRRAAGWQVHVPSFFWSYAEDRSSALVLLGAPSDDALVALWDSGPRRDVLDLVTDRSLPDADLASAEPSDDALWPLLGTIQPR